MVTMRRMILLWLLVSGALAMTASAQLAVQVRVPHSSLLVYESIPIIVSLQNFSGRPIQLADTPTAHWLKLLVTDESNSIVPVTGTLGASEPVEVGPGKAVAQTIDLLTLFALRSRGTYRVQAIVTGPAGTMVSTPVQFELIHGREIWTQTTGLPAGQDDYRTYSLVTRHAGNDELLFVSVREEPMRTMYSLVPLGMTLPTSAPQVKLDKLSHLHVLFQNGPRSYGYLQVDPQAQASERAAYSDFISRPELADKDGVVTVVGGEQTYPKSERLLTEEELNPPPPPKPKPKKKWFWPFGPSPQPGDKY